MNVTSVNTGSKRQIDVGGKPLETGIFKTPLDARVGITRLGLSGDVIASTRHHGGPDQAVYLYSAEEYRWWEAQLGRPLTPGTFGENLTISGFLDAQLRVGDRLSVGDCLLELTAPRIPCATFAARMDDPSFVKRFREARRPGAYARVLREGEVWAGAPVERQPAPADAPGVVELFDLWFDRKLTRAQVERLLRAPIAERAREHYEKQLRSLPA